MKFYYCLPDFPKRTGLCPGLYLSYRRDIMPDNLQFDKEISQACVKMNQVSKELMSLSRLLLKLLAMSFLF